MKGSTNWIVCKVFVFWTIFLVQSGNADVLVRYHGNVLPNELNIQENVTRVDVLATRLEDPGKGRRINSTFSVSNFPWWRIRRWSSTSSEVSGLQFRFGLLSMVEYEESSNGTDGIDSSDYIMAQTTLWDSQWTPFTEASGFGDGENNFYVYGTTHTPRNDTLPVIELTTGISTMRGWVNPASRVLGPNNWEWEIALNSIPLVGNYSRIALKFLVECVGPKPIYRSSIPIAERDSLLDDEDDIIIQLDEVLNNSEDSTDKGFFSWKKQAEEIGGLYPEIDSVLIDMTTQERSLRIVSSPVLSPSQDIVPLTEDILNILQDDPGRVLGESRYFIYISFMVTQPDSITWDPFVGLDEQDESTFTVSAASIPQYLLVTLFLHLYITLL